MIHVRITGQCCIHAGHGIQAFKLFMELKGQRLDSLSGGLVPAVGYPILAPRDSVLCVVGGIGVRWLSTLRHSMMLYLLS